MEFDITHLDRKLLLRSLLAFAEPIGFGIIEYDNRKAKNQNVDGITDEECEVILYEFENMEKGYKRVLDYYRGQPLKLDFYKKANGQMFASSTSYDERNGKYRFLEALLNSFLKDEIKIIRKSYGDHDIKRQPEHLDRPEQVIKGFKKIIDDCEILYGDFGKYWGLRSTFEYKEGVIKYLNI